MRLDTRPTYGPYVLGLALGIGLFLVWLVSCAHATPATHGLPDMQRKMQVWLGDLGGGYVVSGCLPVASATTTLAAFACEAYVQDTTTGELLYVNQPAATLGPLNGGAGTYWVGLRRDSVVDVAGCTEQAGTRYVWCLASTRPAPVSGVLLVAKATVVGTAVPVVLDQRPTPGNRDCVVTQPLWGADPTGNADSTAAFNAALAAGCPVSVPAGTYLVSDITVVDNMDISGPADGRSGKAILLVRSNNAAAFYHSAAATRQNIRVRNLTIQAASGITGAKAWRQLHHDEYTAWAAFEQIETGADLVIAYDGFFILTRWLNCRDGFIGTTPGGQAHQAIVSLPDNYAQATQSNLNQVVRSSFYHGTAGAAAMIVMAYGENWRFDGAHFEDMDSPAILAQGIYIGVCESCWAENVRAAYVFGLAENAAPNVQGSRPWEIRNSYFNLVGLTGTEMLSITGNSTMSVNNVAVTGVPAGVKLTNASMYYIQQISQVYTLGGAGAATFLTGIITQEASDRVTAAFHANQNMLPFGPSNLDEATFTYAGYSAHVNIASALVLSANAVKVTMNNGAPPMTMTYALPAKLVTFLRGKTVTLVALGYGIDAAVLDYWYVRVWDSIAVDWATGSPGTFVDVRATTLGLSYVTVTVSAGATSFTIGVDAGGLNTGKLFVVETLALFTGEPGLIPTSLGTR